MSKKIKNEQMHRTRAEEAIRHTAYRMGLTQWLNITVRFNEGLDDDERVVCRCVADWEYRQASFIWNLQAIAALNDRDLNETAQHELVHALIAPLWCELSDKQQAKLGKLNELATENVARALRHLMEEADSECEVQTP